MPLIHREEVVGLNLQGEIICFSNGWAVARRIPEGFDEIFIPIIFRFAEESWTSREQILAAIQENQDFDGLSIGLN